MPQYTLSPQAQKSLKHIRTYSLETFGKKRTNAYLQALRDRMMMLAAAPSRVRQGMKSRSDIIVFMKAPIPSITELLTPILILSTYSIKKWIQ